MVRIAGTKTQAATNYTAKLTLIYHVEMERIAGTSSLTANIFIHLKKFKQLRFLNKAINFNNNLLRKQQLVANFKRTVIMINVNISIIPLLMVNHRPFMNSIAYFSYLKEIIRLQILYLIKRESCKNMKKRKNLSLSIYQNSKRILRV